MCTSMTVILVNFVMYPDSTHSFLKECVLIEDPYLCMFSYKENILPRTFPDVGYTIFVIEGDLPTCEADQLLTLAPIQADKHTSIKKPPQFAGYHSDSSAGPSRKKQRSNNDDDEFAVELATALSASMATHTQVKGQDEEFDVTIATALSESMRGKY